MKKGKKVNKQIEYDVWLYNNKKLIRYIENYDSGNTKPIILQISEGQNAWDEIAYIMTFLKSNSRHKNFPCFISKKIDCQNRTEKELEEAICFDFVVTHDFVVLAWDEIEKIAAKILKDVSIANRTKGRLRTDRKGLAVARYKSFIYFTIFFEATILFKSFIGSLKHKPKGVIEALIEDFANNEDKKFLSYLHDITYQVATFINVSHKNDVVFEKALTYQKKYFSDAPDLCFVIMTQDSIKKLPKSISEQFEVFPLARVKVQNKDHGVTGGKKRKRTSYKDDIPFLEIIETVLTKYNLANLDYYPTVREHRDEVEDEISLYNKKVDGERDAEGVLIKKIEQGNSNICKAIQNDDIRKEIMKLKLKLEEKNNKKKSKK